MRGAIAFLSTKTWHWHLTKEIKGLRSDETLGNMINRGALSLVSQYSDYTHFYWYVGRWRWKEGECEDLDS